MRKVINITLFILSIILSLGLLLGMGVLILLYAPIWIIKNKVFKNKI